MSPNPSTARISELEQRVKELGLAVEELLTWAERYRGGDKTLHSEEWYIVSEFARRALSGSSAPPRPFHEGLDDDELADLGEPE